MAAMTSIDAGEGDDTVDGGTGDDTIDGGFGVDELFGGDDDDTFIVSSALRGDEDTIVGGNGPDETADFDVLDLRGTGPITIIDAADTSDADARAGIAIFEDGSRLFFNQIEEILTDNNEDPEAEDLTVAGDEDTVISGTVVATDVDGDTLTFMLDTGPSNGSVTVNANGTFDYTPDPDTNGTDSFTVLVDDGNGGSDVATVTVNVTPVNDAPIANDDFFGGSTPTASSTMATCWPMTAIPKRIR